MMKDIERLLIDCKVVLSKVRLIACVYVDRLVYACLQRFLPYKDCDFYPAFDVKLPRVTYNADSCVVAIEPAYAKLTFIAGKDIVDARFHIVTMNRVVFERAYRYKHSTLYTTYTTPLNPDSLPGYVVVLVLRDSLVEAMLDNVVCTLRRICEEAS